MEEIIENMLEAARLQAERIDTTNKRIDLANERITSLKELVDKQQELLIIISKNMRS